MAETATATPPAPPKFKVGMPTPPPPSSEKWSFREIKGTREKIRAAIVDARLKDPKTGQPTEEPLPDPVKNYLLWILDNLEGDVFTLDGHVHAATKSEWNEHLHIKKYC